MRNSNSTQITKTVYSISDLKLDLATHQNYFPYFFPLSFFSHLYCASCYYQSFLLPTDAQENCFQRSIKIYIEIKIAPTCFGVITIIRERTT